MKRVTVLTLPEIQEAVLAALARKPSFRGRFVAALYAIADDSEPRPELRIRFNVVTFDTERAARAYQAEPHHPGDMPAASTEEPDPVATPESVEGAA